MFWEIKQTALGNKIFHEPIVIYWLQASSAAWPSGSERRFYNSRDRKVDGSTPTQASFLRPWIKWFTTIISAWFMESNK